MEYCHKAGIAHSEFLEWSEHDQEAEIAYMLHERERCQNCGTFPDEWLRDGEHVEPPPYVAKSIACLGCETTQGVWKEIPDDRRSTIHVYLAPNEEAKRYGRFGPHGRPGSS